MAELMGLPVAVVPSEILEIRRLLVKLRRAVTRKTHCIRGHERTPENINKQNTCKQCLKILQKNYRERKKAEDPEGWKKNQSAANLRYRTKHPETVKAFHKRYYRLHPEKFNNKKYSDLTERELERRRIYNSSDKILGWHRENSKRKAIALTDSYVVSTIRPKVPLKLATPDLIEVKRQTIRLNRILKSQRRFVNQRREQHVC
jgi:Mg2+ and Co2+ transporter CorA